MTDQPPPDPTVRNGPWGDGWADDGGYLPPPDPTRPYPPAPPGGGPGTGPPPPWSGPPGPGPGPHQGGPGPEQGGPGYGPGPGAPYGQMPPGGAGGYGAMGPGGPPGLVPLGWVASPWGPRWRGPVGQARPAGTTVLLTIITCGIWSYVWSFQNHEELKRYRGDGLGGAIGLVLAILASAAVMFTIPMEIERMYQEEGLPSPVTTMIGLWFLLPIIGNFIWYFQVQRALNDFWVARGARPA